MIKELFLASILSFSTSVRTPNDATKPLDYEFSSGIEKTSGKFTYSIKRDWERELGVNYIDNVVKFTHNYGSVYYGMDHFDKESKNIKYTTHNCGFSHKSGLKAGIAIKSEENELPILAHLSFTTKIKKDDHEYLLDLSAKTDLAENNIFYVKSEIKKWFTPKINVFAFYKHQYVSEQEDFQFKVGLGVKL